MKKTALILIAGLGSAGRRHLRNLQAHGCDRFIFFRTGSGTLPDDELPDFPAFPDIDQALSQKPDICVVANPTALHLPVALKAAAAGCHLLIEKPLSNTIEGLDELSREVEGKNLTTMIGCQFRFHPLLKSLREQMRERIGIPLAFHAEWGECLGDWHPWEDYRNSYSARKDLGGGVILTLIHPLDYLYWMFGPIKRVRAFQSKIEALGTKVNDDMALISLEFRSGIKGTVHLDFVQKPPVHSLKIIGERGTADWDYHRGTLLWTDRNGAEEMQKTPDSFERNSMFLSMTSHFLECVAAGQQSSIPLADGITVLEIALQAKRDAGSGKVRGD
ncbi:Gfo/Idh/MocA family protein [Gemmatimonadota bacterium]